MRAPGDAREREEEGEEEEGTGAAPGGPGGTLQSGTLGIAYVYKPRN